MTLLYSANSKNYNSEKVQLANVLKNIISKDSVFFCIGTDKLIYDAIGPLVGHKLKEKAPYLNIYGTLEFPVHANNLNKQLEIMKQKHPASQIIAIDASVTENPNLVNHIEIYNEPVNPGGGLGKNLTKVGDYKIIGIIDIRDNPDIFRKGIRLYYTNLLSDLITDSILIALEE